MAYQGVFQRVEKKYLLRPAQLDAIQDALHRSMSPDGFGISHVTSLYLDTSDYVIAERTLDRPIYREKLRFRTYGALQGDMLEAICGLHVDDGTACFAGERPSSDDAALPVVYFELKKKFRGVVYKRRCALSLYAAEAFLQDCPLADAMRRHPLPDDVSPSSSPWVSMQIARELEAAFSRYDDLSPKIAITCDRVAFEPDDPSGSDVADLRVTFDANVRYANIDDARESARCDAPSSDFHPIIGADETLMELKCRGPLPLWLVDVLNREKIYPCSFTKYGNAYRLSMRNRVASSSQKGACCA